MAEDRKDEAKAPHWTSGQLTEAASHPHSPDIKEQGGAGAGLVRSANGFPYQEGEEPGLGSREQPGTYARSKENGINGELSAGDRETAGNVTQGSAAEPGLCCPWEDICHSRMGWGREAARGWQQETAQLLCIDSTSLSCVCMHKGWSLLLLLTSNNTFCTSTNYLQNNASLSLTVNTTIQCQCLLAIP